MTLLVIHSNLINKHITSELTETTSNETTWMSISLTMAFTALNQRCISMALCRITSTLVRAKWYSRDQTPTHSKMTPSTTQSMNPQAGLILWCQATNKEAYNWVTMLWLTRIRISKTNMGIISQINLINLLIQLRIFWQGQAKKTSMQASKGKPIRIRRRIALSRINITWFSSIWNLSMIWGLRSKGKKIKHLKIKCSKHAKRALLRGWNCRMRLKWWMGHWKCLQGNRNTWKQQVTPTPMASPRVELLKMWHWRSKGGSRESPNKQQRLHKNPLNFWRKKKRASIRRLGISK